MYFVGRWQWNVESMESLTDVEMLQSFDETLQLMYTCADWLYFQSSVCRSVIELSVTAPIRLMMKTVLYADHCTMELTIPFFWHVTLCCWANGLVILKECSAFIFRVQQIVMPLCSKSIFVWTAWPYHTVSSQKTCTFGNTAVIISYLALWS